MRQRDEPLHVALEAASIVYRYHHPEVTEELAVQTVVGWLTERENDTQGL